MQTLELQISGMMCSACVQHVTQALQNVAGVQSVAVDLSRASATITGENLVVSHLVEVVEEEGYNAIQAKSP